jgi:hypothetical protein
MFWNQELPLVSIMLVLAWVLGSAAASEVGSLGLPWVTKLVHITPNWTRKWSGFL